MTILIPGTFVVPLAIILVRTSPDSAFIFTTLSGTGIGSGFVCTAPVKGLVLVLTMLIPDMGIGLGCCSVISPLVSGMGTDIVHTEPVLALVLFLLILGMGISIVITVVVSTSFSLLSVYFRVHTATYLSFAIILTLLSGMGSCTGDVPLLSGIGAVVASMPPLVVGAPASDGASRGGVGSRGSGSSGG